MRFDAAGTYRLWLRTYAISNGNSLHAGLDGRLGAGPHRQGGLLVVDAGGISVPAAGERLVTLWMREDGLAVDRLVLTAKTSYAPRAGPAATPRG